MGSGGREISILSNSLTAKLSTPPLSMVQKEKQQTLCVCVCVCVCEYIYIYIYICVCVCIHRYIDILCNIMFVLTVLLLKCLFI